MKYILIFFCLLSVSFQALAQDKKKATNGEFWGKSEAYLHKQAFQMFGLIDEALTQNPPVVGAPMVRKLALYNLDAMLHETKYDNTEPFNNFVDSRMQKLLVELNNPVKKGLKILKVYNDGFIARTQSTTIAFDIVRGSIQGKEIVSEECIKQIVEHCDILFITHNHGDHADRLARHGTPYADGRPAREAAHEPVARRPSEARKVGLLQLAVDGVGEAALNLGDDVKRRTADDSHATSPPMTPTRPPCGPWRPSLRRAGARLRLRA